MKKVKSNNTFVKNIIILLLIIFTLHTLFTNLFAAKEIKTKEFVVFRGQTLWSIAEDLYSDNNIDIHKAIYDIKEINNLSESIIYEGQVLNVPVYE